MNTRNLFLFLFSISASFSFAQTRNNAEDAAQVIYRFQHIKDTNQLTKVHQEDMMLTFTNVNSIYKSYTWFYDDSVSTVRIMQGNTKLEPIRLGKYTLETLYRTMQPEGLYKIQSLMGDTVAIVYDYPTINWELINENKIIGEYTCKKARGSWRGRVYDVWYAPEIAVPFGPWKLGGLPGLILEATDLKKQVSFEFVGFKSGVVATSNVLKGKRILSQSEYTTFIRNLVQDPNGMLQGAIGANNSMKIERTDNTAGAAGSPRSRNNNPLELTN